MRQLATKGGALLAIAPLSAHVHVRTCIHTDAYMTYLVTADRVRAIVDVEMVVAV